jgi:hypothetical protein
MTKRKLPLHPVFKMDFVSSLPLDEALRIIKDLNAPDMPLKIHENSSLKYPKFSITQPQYIPFGGGEVSGRLRAGEGSSTRLECDFWAKPWAEDVTESLSCLYYVCFLASGCLLSVLPSLSLTREAAWGWLLLMIALTVVLVGFTAYCWFNRDRAVNYYGVYILMERVLEALKAAGDVSIDSSQLEALLDAIEAEQPVRKRHQPD